MKPFNRDIEERKTARYTRLLFVAFAMVLGFAYCTAPAKAQALLWPIERTGGVQYTSSLFGTRQSPQGGGGSEFHTGIDIACRVGTPVLAVADGTVTVCATKDPVFGNYMIVALDCGITALYGHMSETWVARGKRVRAGQVIGLSGNTGISTGPHVHFGVMVDPMTLFTVDTSRWGWK